MVCWESLELKSKISWSPKCLQNQHIPMSEGGAALHSRVCVCNGLSLLSSLKASSVSQDDFLLVLPSKCKRLPHTHVLTTTYNAELSLFYLIIHWLSFSQSPVSQMAISRLLRTARPHSLYLYPDKDIIIYPNYNNTLIMWYLSTTLHISKPSLWWKGGNYCR